MGGEQNAARAILQATRLPLQLFSSCIVASFVPRSQDYGGPRAAYDSWVRRIYLCFVLIRGNHEPFNRLALNESIHNLRDVRDRDAPVKKMIGFD